MFSASRCLSLRCFDNFAVNSLSSTLCVSSVLPSALLDFSDSSADIG